MAAEAVVSAVFKTALSASLEEIGLLWGFKDDLNRLVSTFGTIQLVLHDAEIKQRKSEAIQNWLWKLKNVAYDAENILDGIATHGFRRRLDSQRGTKHQLKSFLSRKNPSLFRFEMVHEMKNIREKLDAIAKERHDYHLMEGVAENRLEETSKSRQTSSLVNESEILGKDGEKENIIGELLGSCDREDLSVYAICGMGGLGKTTLAQLAYTDQRTEKHFELLIWVCVSDDFSIQRLVRAILESIEGSGCNISELDPLQRRLQEKLKGRRYLLVLDDVWNENHRLWDELKEVLRCGSKGSVLMATTRIEKVAIMMAASTIHHIECLSENDSWFLFKQRAFPIGEEEEENLAAIGKVIVKKCGGVPLAINALGSLMQYKSLENEWLAIKDSEIWHLVDDEHDILPVLRLSYDNIPPYMRQCFAYCSIFPKDYKMKKDELIQLWMANGYLHSDGQPDLYLMGQLTFKELVWRSFLQDVDISSGGVARCKMHILMHDVASSVMRHETCILEHGHELKIPKTPRHLSFYTSSSWGDLANKSQLKRLTDDSLRSIIVLRVQEGAKGLYSLISKQRYLRVLVLDADLTPTSFLIPAVCKLEHLRYLVLSCFAVQKLPESLTRLINLQTLKFTNSNFLLELPKGLRLMKILWFLEMDNFDSLLCTPPRLGDITCLRKLSVFIVGEDAAYQIGQLKELNLGGTLSIKGLQNVRNSEDAKSANLMTKCDLTSLSLSWKNNITDNSAEHSEEVLEGLQPHPNLENICIQSYQGSRFPNWVSTLAFKRLKKIRLKDCPRCEYLPPLGKLPSLTSLYIKNMGSVRNLDARSHGDGERSFPALKVLEIENMPNLEEWITMDSIESFPCLEDLSIDMCPKLTGLPNLMTLKRLHVYDSSAMLPRSIKFVTSLTSLHLFRFADLDVISEGSLSNHKALESLFLGRCPIRTLPKMLADLSLKILGLYHCHTLESLSEGLKHLSFLETLTISNCDGLRSFPATMLEGLPSLKSLSFQFCKKLKPLSGPLNRAPALHELSLGGLPKLEHLPESMQLMSALSVLRIQYCGGLSSLPIWFTHLESLSRIEIGDCKSLNSLPDDFRSLKSLRYLEIIACPQLTKRCEKIKGADWPKISHIPFISIRDHQ